MIVYKVVRNVNGRLLSCSEVSSQFEVEYKKKKWTFPKYKGSRLFVFDTLVNAKMYCSLHGEEIWECEVNKTFKCVSAMSTLLTFWLAKIRHQKVSHLQTDCSFGGALMVDSLRLIKKVG